MPITTMSLTDNAGELLRCRCEDLVATEMARLARRVPALCSRHLGQVEAALGKVMDDLVLSRARAVREDDLTVLFDLADAR